MKILLILLSVGISLALPAVVSRQKREDAEETSDGGSDLAELAREFCREKLAAMRLAHGFFADPLDCHSFYQCYRQGDVIHAANYPCPAGTVWNEESLTCQAPLNGGCNDPCKDELVAMVGYYPSTSNCAEFYQCDNGVSVRQCCPNFLSWNQTARQCDNTAPCDMICKHSLPEPDTDLHEVILADSECRNGNYIYGKGPSAAEYTIRPVVKSEENQEEEDDEEEEEDDIEVGKGRCPESAPVFDLEHCGCIGHDPLKFTESSSCLTFDYDEEITPGYPVWTDNFDTIIRDGAMCFDGHARLEVSYYRAMHWGTGFSLRFSYTLEGELEGKTESLLTNSAYQSPATISVELVNGDVQATLLPQSTLIEQDCQVALPAVTPGGVVEVVYDGKAGGKGLTLKVDEEEVSASCTGDVKTSPNPIIFGSTFVGCLDEVKICTHL